MGNDSSKPENAPAQEVKIPELLINANLDNTMKFDTGVANRRMIGKVIDVIDGDTVSVAADINGGYYWFRVRIYGIDTPELHPRLNVENREAIIESAEKAKKRTQELINGKIVVLDCKLFDNFGRLIAKVYVPKEDMSKLPGHKINLLGTDNMINVSQVLLDEGHAVPFVK